MVNTTALGRSTTNKVTTGEAIERPASVVKELLGSVIDIHATAVIVEVKDGGCSMVRITDNGWGIPREKIPLASLRHATSRIETIEGLFTIPSLGFHGETLISIAAVARVELVTKTGGSLTGSRYRIRGGVEKELGGISAPEGTTIIVRSLFYNTSARKRFLKAPTTEGAHVATLVEKIVFSHPDISIRFIQNNQNKLYISGNHDLKGLVCTVFGQEIMGSLLSVGISKGWTAVTGFISRPIIARSDRSYEGYLIDSHYIKSTVISRAIKEVYKPCMIQHEYPFTMPHFRIEPDTLDVNMHPTKMGLRFTDEERVYNTVLKAVSNTLAYEELVPQANLKVRQEKEARQLTEKLAPRPEPFEARRRENLNQKAAVNSGQMHPGGPSPSGSVYAQSAPSGPSFINEPMPGWLKERKKEQEGRPISPAALNFLRGTCKTEPPVREDRMGTDIEKSASIKKDAGSVNSDTPNIPPDQFAGSAAEPKQPDLFDGRLLDLKARLEHELIGQLFDTYRMVKYNEQLLIIDQHAARGKMLCENTVKFLKTRQYNMQMVDPPIVLTLNMSRELLLERHMDYFTEIGFEMELFGGREYTVHGVPVNLFSTTKEELLTEVIDGLLEDMSVYNPDTIYEKVASMSCRAAVKGHHTVPFQETNMLTDQLLGLENPYACPHGRPTIISVNKYELEKEFKRIV